MLRRSLLLVLLLSCAGCRTRAAEPERSAGPPPGPGPWTQAFMRDAALLADEIVIEGPADLLDHVAIAQDSEVFAYVTRTTNEGLLQELTVKPGFGPVEIRAQLDAWALAATRRLVVLQRPGEVPVLVRATGNAVWLAGDGGPERRESVLSFRGERASVPAE